MHLCTQTVWEDIWKPTLEKSRSNATNATSDLFTQTIWEHIWNSQWRKVVQMQLCICSDSQFEKTFENSILRKIVQIQPTWLTSLHSDDLRKHWKTHTGKSNWNATNATICICFGRQCEKTFENSLWRKIVYMQPTRLRICSLRRFEKTFETHTGIKSLKCNQCDYAPVLAGNWKRKLTLEKNRSNSTNATSHLFTQTIWENIWKLTLEKVIEMQPMRLCICFGR